MTVRVDLRSISRSPATLKAMSDARLEGSILPLRLYRPMYPENLTPEGFPKAGVLEHFLTVRTAPGGARLIQNGKCHAD